MQRLIVIVCTLLSFGAHAAPVYVDDAWLAARLDDPRVVIVDMSDATQYQRFHVPGAIHLPYDALLKPPARTRVRERLDDNALTSLLGNIGIARTHHVVLYDDLGALDAARLFWELERIGHPQVSVLDGGLVRWVLNGRKVVNGPVTRAPVNYRAEGTRRANEAGLADVRRASQTGDALMLDVRSEEEYVGSPREPRSGHVPGAAWWPWEQAVDFENGFVRRHPKALRASLARAGAADATKPVIAYCRSGHRAAQTYLALRGLGYENVRLYANSMLEYAAEAGAPLNQGKRP